MNNEIRVSKQPGEKKFRSIPIENATVQSLNDWNNRHYCFQVNPSGLPSVWFAAKVEADRNQWVDLLQVSRQRRPLPGTTPPNSIDADIPSNQLVLTNVMIGKGKKQIEMEKKVI